VPKVGMPEIRKPQLINATMEAINEVGLLKASVAKIAGIAGVSPAIINHYFGGKDGLLEETMRYVLKELFGSVAQQSSQADADDVMARVVGIVQGNFAPKQLDPKVVKTWLAFWSQAMHKPQLHRLQRANEQRLLSHLRYELKKVMSRERAVFHAQAIAALIDGIWLRGALSPEGINKPLAEAIIVDYLERCLPEGKRRAQNV